MHDPKNGTKHDQMPGPALMARIADALERLAPAAPSAPDFAAAEAFTWHPVGRRVAPVTRVSRVGTQYRLGPPRHPLSTLVVRA